MNKASGAAEGRLLMLSVGGERFAMPVAIVREVARMPRLTRVPHAPPALMGLANIRGAVVPVLSLASLVEHPAGAVRRVVIIDDGEVLGLAVDEAAQLIETDAADAEVRTLDVSAMVARCLPKRAMRRARGAAVINEEQVAPQADLVALVIFAIGAQEFAFPLATVEEVLRMPEEIAAIPLADAAVVGTTAVRGTLIPLLSLRALLALPGADDHARARILVVRMGTHHVGLVVDAMRATAQVPEDQIDPVPQVLVRGGGEARIRSIARLDGGKRLVSVLAAEQVVRDDITARLLQAVGEQEDAGKAPVDERFEQFLLFRIGRQEFGLPIAAVDEVVPLPAKLARLPRAPAFVQGVMNLRGRAIAVIDQAARFGIVETAGQRRRVVIVRLGDLIAGFAVDAVTDVLRVSINALHPAPDLDPDGTRVFDRVADLTGGQVLLIVSPRELLDRLEQDLLRSMLTKGKTITP